MDIVKFSDSLMWNGMVFGMWEKAGVAGGNPGNTHKPTQECLSGIVSLRFPSFVLFFSVFTVL